VIRTENTTGTASGVATPAVDLDLRPSTPPLPGRTIRFPDESHPHGSSTIEQAGDAV